VREHRAFVEVCRRLNAAAGRVSRRRFRSRVDEQVRCGFERRTGTSMAAVDRSAVSGFVGRRRLPDARVAPARVREIRQRRHWRPHVRAIAVTGAFPVPTGSGLRHVTSGGDVLHVVAVGRVMAQTVSGNRPASPAINNDHISERKTGSTLLILLLFFCLFE